MAGPRPQPQGPVCLSSPQVPGRCADPLARTVAVRASPIRPKTGVRAGAISGDSARCRRRTDLGLGARPSNRLLERRARSQRLPAPPSPSTAPSGTAGSAPFRRLFGQNLIDLGRSEKVGSPLILPRHEALESISGKLKPRSREYRRRAPFFMVSFPISPKEPLPATYFGSRKLETQYVE